jgi:hypothetical protein
MASSYAGCALVALCSFAVLHATVRGYSLQKAVRKRAVNIGRQAREALHIKAPAER